MWLSVALLMPSRVANVAGRGLATPAGRFECMRGCNRSLHVGAGIDVVLRMCCVLIVCAGVIVCRGGVVLFCVSCVMSRG